MASLSSATFTAPSFAAPARAVTRRSAFTVRASLGLDKAAFTVAASALLAGGAMAQEVLLGANGGVLVFEPSEFTVKAGDTITFKNNAGYPHNVVFDEDEMPSGVDATKISQEEYLNAPGETYSFYCEPHQGAGGSAGGGAGSAGGSAAGGPSSPAWWAAATPSHMVAVFFAPTATPHRGRAWPQARPCPAAAASTRPGELRLAPPP